MTPSALIAVFLVIFTLALIIAAEAKKISSLKCEVSICEQRVSMAEERASLAEAHTGTVRAHYELERDEQIEHYRKFADDLWQENEELQKRLAQKEGIHERIVQAAEAATPVACDTVTAAGYGDTEDTASYEDTQTEEAPE